MIIKSTFLATAVAAGALFFGGTSASEARPRISFHVDTGGYYGGHYGGHYQRGYCPPRRPVYHRPVYHRPSHHYHSRGGYYRQPSYRQPHCRY